MENNVFSAFSVNANAEHSVLKPNTMNKEQEYLEECHDDAQRFKNFMLLVIAVAAIIAGMIIINI